MKFVIDIFSSGGTVLVYPKKNQVLSHTISRFPENSVEKGLSRIPAETEA